MSLQPDESSAVPRPDSRDAVDDIGDAGQFDAQLVSEKEDSVDGRVLEYLQEARGEEVGEVEAGLLTNGSAFRRFKAEDEAQGPSSPDRAPSSTGSYSTPDDTPSLHVCNCPRRPLGCPHGLCVSQGSITSSAFSAMGSRFSPSPSLRPFDRRFQSRLHPPSPGQSSPRALSPSLLGVHSRNSSIGDKPHDVGIDGLLDCSAPWEVVRWTKLKKITSQIFSDPGRRSFGTPTCINVSATIALGTSKGIILVFDYSQSLKAIIGPGTKGRLVYGVMWCYGLTICSCRVRADNRIGRLCRLHDDCWWPREWTHIHLGAGEAVSAILKDFTFSGVPDGEPKRRRTR